MRGVRFTKAEVAYLGALLGPGSCDHDPRLDGSILAKVEAAAGPQVAGVNAGALERALVDSARGKVVAIEAGAGSYGRVSRQATAVGATPQAASVIGSWIASQSWLTGPLTVFTVLNKWPDWLARARATAAPDGLPEGDLGSRPPAPRPKTTAGRRAPGIG